VRAFSPSLRRLLYNPLFISDGLARVRTWRAPAVVALYLAVLGLVALVQFQAQQSSSFYGTGQVDVGSAVFTAVALAQLALICAFAPALAAGAISGERERQTFDVLTASRMKPWHIVWGKLVSSIAFVVLLILAAMPLLSTAFLFGGVDVGQFLVTLLLTASTALAVAAVALFASALVRRSLVSTVVAYGAVTAWTAGTAVLGSLLSFLYFRSSQSGVSAGPGPAQPDLHPLLFANPFFALTAVLQPGVTGGAVHLGRAAQILFMATGTPSTAGPLVQAWQAAALAELLVVALCVFGAIQVLRGRRALLWRRPRRQA
jgi:ABC-2 type transport system permease protein